jgi:hypothetical protein
MGRGWTWMDSATDEQMETLSAANDELARQWSALHDGAEQRRFARQADIEDGYDDYEYEDEADRLRVEQIDTLRARQHEAQVQVIEDMLHENGARMMRPYEHWNEDERYMQYMECGRFGDSCY